MISIAMNGALGRMGTRILTLAHKQSKDFKIAAAFEPKNSPYVGKDLASILGLGEELKLKITELNAANLKGVNVVIDFSSPQGTIACVKEAIKSKTGVVIGTTGIESGDVKFLQSAAKKIPILFSPNMSIGANFLFEVARIAAQKLNTGYDIELIEAHHRLKKDAPSGTAKKIAEVIAEAKGWDLKKVAKYGREGITGERGKDEFGIHVIRGGDIVGEHTIMFSGPGETIQLKHTALSRDAFAKGALVAAQFLAKKKNGFYSMKDVL